MVQFTSTPSRGTEDEKAAVNGVSSATTSGQNTPNGTTKRKPADSGVDGDKKRIRRSRNTKVNGQTNGQSISRRRLSVSSKPARDPRDEASPQRQDTGINGTRSSDPFIDFDGLSRPSKSSSYSMEYSS